ncbi:hypothetical protein OG943_14600 [Amycolatopsis sp. NBC_00345]|uniref:hypothetical protein n=1 Tax=Amycolatopsis sp. NBC_00345 TaxID=2975955 RepID=UPI002E26DCED
MTTTVQRVRSGARLRDLVWVAWRQRRLLILTTAALAAVLVAWSLWLYAQAGDPPTCVPGRPCNGNITGQWIDGINSQARLLFGALAAFSGLLPAFWGAPVVAREFEQRTYLWAWTQDVPLRRWLGIRVLFFGGVIALSSALAGTAASLLWERINASGWRGSLIDDRLGFEFSPTVQLGYAVFGFALGLALGALTRRTQIALGLTTLVFAATRLLIGQFARPFPFFTPLREVWPVTGTRTGLPRVSFNDTLFHSPGLLDRAGNAVSYDSPISNACFSAATAPNATDLQGVEDRCFLDHGIVQRFFDYQPIDRLAALRLTETAVYLALAAALFTVTWRRMRKAVATI